MMRRGKSLRIKYEQSEHQQILFESYDKSLDLYSQALPGLAFSGCLTQVQRLVTLNLFVLSV